MNLPDGPIENKALAWDMAHAEYPYWELRQHAKLLGLGSVAVQMLKQANEASDEIHMQFLEERRKIDEPLEIEEQQRLIKEAKEKGLDVVTFDEFSSFHRGKSYNRVRMWHTLVDAVKEDPTFSSTPTVGVYLEPVLIGDLDSTVLRLESGERKVNQSTRVLRNVLQARKSE